MKTYTVVGIYENTGQSFIDWVDAPSAYDARSIAEDKTYALLVAAVFLGKLYPEDCK